MLYVLINRETGETVFSSEEPMSSSTRDHTDYNWPTATDDSRSNEEVALERAIKSLVDYSGSELKESTMVHVSITRNGRTASGAGSTRLAALKSLLREVVVATGTDPTPRPFRGER